MFDEDSEFELLDLSPEPSLERVDLSLPTQRDEEEDFEMVDLTPVLSRAVSRESQNINERSWSALARVQQANNLSLSSRKHVQRQRHVFVPSMREVVKEDENYDIPNFKMAATHKKMRKFGYEKENRKCSTGSGNSFKNNSRRSLDTQATKTIKKIVLKPAHYTETETKILHGLFLHLNFSTYFNISFLGMTEFELEQGLNFGNIPGRGLHRSLDQKSYWDSVEEKLSAKCDVYFERKRGQYAFSHSQSRESKVLDRKFYAFLNPDTYTFKQSLEDREVAKYMEELKKQENLSFRLRR